jgi:hypothetical protein
MGVVNFRQGVASFGNLLVGDGSKDISGSTYFVDGNSGADGNKGDSFLRPFKTLTKAFAVSNADIARGSDRWARRNTIYVSGDQIEENLVTQPEKCDVRGVGSDSGYPMAGIKGNHAPVDGHFGTRWYNIRFIPDTAAPIFTLASTSGNPEFYDCLFDADGDAVATTAITTATVSRLKVIGCEFVGNTTGFSTAAISIGSGAGVGITIANNLINSASIGILIAGHSGVGCWILKNFIKSTGICISAASTVFHIVGNRGITLNDNGTALAGAVIGSVALALDNAFTCSGTDGHIIWPPITAVGT